MVHALIAASQEYLTMTGGHILVIDQEPAILDLIRELLEGEGFGVSTRQSIDSDLQEIKRLAPNLIILDPVWPAQPASASLLQRLRLDKETCAIPVVLCTGDFREEEFNTRAVVGLEAAIIPKPFDIAGFMAVVHRALEESLTQCSPWPGHDEASPQ
jgi:DNA-binding response OmpR family regulator